MASAVRIPLKVKPELDVLPVGFGAPAGLAEAVVGDDPGRAGAPEGMSEGMSEGILEGVNEGGCVTVKLLVVMLLLSDVIYPTLPPFTAIDNMV